MTHLTKFLPLVLALAAVPPIAHAQPADPAVPFGTSNQNPLVAIYGLPPAGAATVLAPGANEAELRADIASSCSQDESPEESVLLDGESYRFTLALKRGFGERFELGVEIPYVMHREGSLDSFIDDWHDFFQLPEGERDELPNDQLNYRYVNRDERTGIDLAEESDGLGDVRLTGAWQLWRQDGDEPRALALRASLKLPTGDEDDLLGSGSTDLALWLSGSQSYRQGSLALFGALGALLMSDGDVLEEQQRNVAAFGTLGGGWRPLPRLALKAQIDAHTAFYDDSDVSELSDSVQLVFGGTVGVTDTLALDIAVSEDIAVDTAPDIVFHLALRKTF